MSPLRAWTGSYAAMTPLPSSWGVSSLRTFGSTPLPLCERTSSRATRLRTPLPTDHCHTYASSLIVSTTLWFILYSGRDLHTIARPRHAASKKMQIIHESFLHHYPTAWAATLSSQDLSSFTTASLLACCATIQRLFRSYHTARMKTRCHQSSVQQLPTHFSSPSNIHFISLLSYQSELVPGGLITRLGINP
jgi:hypothetical protein